VTRDETRRQMTAMVRRWQASTKTQATFAAAHGLSRAKLRYWHRRVGHAIAAAPVFAPVQVQTPPERKAGAIEVVLVNGERVVVYGGASAELVRTVLAAVRPAC
jgi:hypothetical protein